MFNCARYTCNDKRKRESTSPVPVDIYKPCKNAHGTKHRNPCDALTKDKRRGYNGNDRVEIEEICGTYCSKARQAPVPAQETKH